MAKDYRKFTQDELIKYIEELQLQLKNEKYGLYWDKSIEIEECVNLCKTNIPLFSRKLNYDLYVNGSNNLLIEGDNYHSLTALKMLGREFIDVCYIDPPYNTGHTDFVYNDKYVEIEDGYRHSKWLSFMHKRLLLLRDILKPKSLVFISIDDREYAQLKLLCDSIFSEKNYITTLKWKKKKQPSFLSKVASILEYVLVYSKDASLIKKLSIDQLSDSDKPLINASNKECERIIRAGIRVKCSQTFIKAGIYQNKTMSIEYLDDINIENGRTTNEFRCVAKFRTSQEYLDDYCEKDLIFITSNLGLRRDLDESEKGSAKSITDLLLEWGQNQDGTTELKSIFSIKNETCPFSNPKPVLLIKNCIKSSMFEDPVVLDFFAGSGTTGQAVLELNKEDGGNRRFILCTNNENNICTDVTYPRLKTVITGIRPDGTKYSDGIPANLIYYKTDFIKDSNNTDQAKYCLVEKVDELLCISEDIFVQLERNDYSSHYVSNDEKRHMFIYSDYYNETKFNEFKQRVLSSSGTKVVYIFSSDNNVDDTLFEEIKDVEVKPIPSKIYEIYKEVVEDIKRG